MPFHTSSAKVVIDGRPWDAMGVSRQSAGQWPGRAIKILLGVVLIAPTGCDMAAPPAGGGAGTGAAAPAANEVVVEPDLRGVKVTRILPANLSIYDIGVSPDGSRFYVKRNVSQRMNTQEYQIDIDGTRASPDQPGDVVWSNDGKTVGYISQSQFAVVDGVRFGPFPDLRFLALANGGKTWACLQESKTATGIQRTLLINGKPAPAPVTAHRLWYDAAGQLLIGDQFDAWTDASGKAIPAPVPAPRALPAATVSLRTVAGPAIKTNITGAPPKWIELSVSGKVVGTYPFVVRRPKSDGIPAGYQQPDGRVMFYVVDGDKLIRKYVRPGA